MIRLKLNWLIISSLLNSNFLFFWQIYRPITSVSVKWNSQTFFWSFFDWVNFYMNFPSYQSFLKTFILVIWTGGNYLVVFDNYITASDVRHESNPFSYYIISVISHRMLLKLVIVSPSKLWVYETKKKLPETIFSTSSWGLF